MKKTISVLLTGTLALILISGMDSPCQAEQAGNLQEALAHYVHALQSASQGSAEELELREKIIKLAQRMHPPPAIPEEALRHMARGEAAVEAATDGQGYIRAAEEFKKALIAPWLANVYYNLGVVLDKAGKYDEAIRNLRLYLVAMPDANDAKMLMYKIEYRKESESMAMAKKQEKIRKDQRQRDTCKALEGIWRRYTDKYGYDSDTYEVIHTEESDIIIDSHFGVEGEKFEGGRMRKAMPGDKIRSRRYKLGGPDGLTLLDGNGETAGKVNENIDEIRIYLRIPGKPDYTYIYHKCRTLSVDSSLRDVHL